MIPMSSSSPRATMARHVENNDESSMRDESKRGTTFAENGTTDESSSLIRRAIEELATIIIERTTNDLPPADSPLNSSPKNMATTTTSTTTSSTDRSSSYSIVHIIGTGLNPTLLNLPLSTLLLLSRADVVLYDSLGLSMADISRIVPAHCEVICVGKRGDQKSNSNSWKQDDINELLLQKSIEPSSSFTNQQQQQQRRSIVRLKGGDPFLFGRTLTEIHTLRSNNISYTYTPGISSCIAGPHLVGIPLTDSTLNCQSFGVWSGTDAFGRSRGLDRNDDDSAADGGDDDDSGNSGKQQLQQQQSLLSVDTLVFLMIGRLDKLDALCQFIAKLHGDNGNDGKWNANTPCAIIQNAGGTRLDLEIERTDMPVQRVWRSTLGKLVSDIKEEDPTCVSVSPAVLVVGATAALDLLSQEY